MISVIVVNNRLYIYGKVELGLNSFTKMKRWRYFIYGGLHSTEKIVGHIYFIAYSEDKFISQFLLDYISAIVT